MADPVVLKREGWWYITGTQNYYYRGKKLTRDALERKTLKLEIDSIRTAGDVWGISFYQHTDGKWHGYGTLHLGHFRTVIAHFSPRVPERKWSPGNMIDHWVVDDILIGDIAGGKTTMYDQKMYREGNALFLVYNASPAPHKNVEILAQGMIDPVTPDPDAPPICLLRPEGLRSEDRNAPGGMQLTEGTTIHRMGGKFILLYSVGDFKTANYKLGMAWSDTFIPRPGRTYQKVRRLDTSNVWKNDTPVHEVHYLLQSSQPRWPNYCGTWIKGPGIGTLVEEKGRTKLLFHGYPSKRNTLFEDGRMMFSLPCETAVSGARPPHAWIKPLFPDKQSTSSP